jgi:chromosome segregation ATPase
MIDHMAAERLARLDADAPREEIERSYIAARVENDKLVAAVTGFGKGFGIDVAAFDSVQEGVDTVLSVARVKMGPDGDLATKYQALVVEHKKAKTEILGLKGELDNVKIDNERQEEVITEMDSTITALQAKDQVWQSKVDGYAAKLAELEGKLETSETEFTAMKIANVELEDAFEPLKISNVELDREVKRLTAELASSRAELAATKTELKQFKISNAELNREVQRLTQDLKETASELADTELKLEAQIGVFSKKLKTATTKLETQLDTMTTHADDVEQRLVATETELKQAAKKLSATEAELKQVAKKLSDDLSATEAELRDAKQITANDKRELEIVARQLAEAHLAGQAQADAATKIKIELEAALKASVLAEQTATQLHVDARAACEHTTQRLVEETKAVAALKATVDTQQTKIAELLAKTTDKQP